VSFVDRFTGRADAYVASRPSYPPEAIDALLAGLGDPPSLVVADLGAGTGISSRALASRGPRVIAIEPNAKMRDAAAPDERITWIDGIAERTTLADASVDVAVAFQAWHWVDHPAGVAEARRIVRPGGAFAVVYNERDEADAFTAGYGAIIGRFAQDDTEQRRAVALAAVEAVDPPRTQRVEFTHVHRLDRAGVHQRANSSSYLPQTGAAATALHAELDALMDRFGTEPYGMALVTIVVRVDAG
jgi:SAM-dependent methyltransferase